MPQLHASGVPDSARSGRGLTLGRESSVREGSRMDVESAMNVTTITGLNDPQGDAGTGVASSIGNSSGTQGGGNGDPLSLSGSDQRLFVPAPDADRLLPRPGVNNADNQGQGLSSMQPVMRHRILLGRWRGCRRFASSWKHFGCDPRGGYKEHSRHASCIASTSRNRKAAG